MVAHSAACTATNGASGAISSIEPGDDADAYPPATDADEAERLMDEVRPAEARVPASGGG